MLAIEMIREWAGKRALVVKDGIGRGCVFDWTGTFRILLWDGESRSLPFLGFGMLNPSSAAHDEDDPTFARCRARSARGGYGGTLLWNLFDYRATDPRDLKAAQHPISDWNDSAIMLATEIAGDTIAAWGTHGVHLGRDIYVRRVLGSQNAALQHLGLTKDGHPRHPLYLPASVKPQLWDYIP